MNVLGFVAFIAMGAGCATTRDVSPEPTLGGDDEVARDNSESSSEAVTPAMLRLLPADANYAALLHRVQRLMALDPNIEGEGEGCLLRARGELVGWALAGELAPALRPLPEPMGARRRLPRGPVRVLSRWGQQGDGAAATFVAWTASAPPDSERALVLMLRQRAGRLQAALRSTAEELGDLERFQSWEAVKGHLAEVNPPQLYVSAEAALPLGALAVALGDLRGAEVVLVVPLAPGTTLPTSPTPSTDGLCTEGLPPAPATDSDGDGVGNGVVRSPEALREGLASFAPDARDCLVRAGAAGSRGGALVAEFRVEATGRVEAACIREDEIGSGQLRSCLLAGLRRLSFAPAAEASTLRLPLRLAPSRERSQTALCP